VTLEVPPTGAFLYRLKVEENAPIDFYLQAGAALTIDEVVALGGQPGTDGTPEWAFVVQIYSDLQTAGAGQVLTADGAGGATWEDGGDFMPKVDPAVAGNLVVQAADGTLSDAGYAADEAPMAGSVVRRGAEGEVNANSTANSAIFASSISGVAGEFVSNDGLGVFAQSLTNDRIADFANSSAVVSAIARTTGNLVFLGASADANRAAQRLEILASPLRPAQTDIAGTTHTFALTNEGQILASQSGDPTEFSIPLDSSVAFPVGAIVGAQQQGAGVLTIKAVAGVTLNGVDGGSKAITVQWGAVAIQKLSTNGWTIIGAI
jgi:hypothetical protein